MRGSATARPLLPAALASGDDVLRTAAAQAAGELGDAASVDILIRMAGEEDPPGKAAREALGRIPDPRVASLLLEQFQTGEIPARILALNILVTRGYLPVLDDLFDARLFDSPEMAKATTTALRALCSAETFPRALSVLAKLAPEKKPVLISALGRIAQNMGNDARAVEQVQKTMEASSDVDRGHLLVIFAALQGNASLRALSGWLTSDSLSVRKETIRTLGKWNNDQSAELLLEAAQKDPDPALRMLAIRSLLAVLQKRGATQTPQEGVALLKRMLPVAECLEEKRAIISCLPGFKCQEALDWAPSLINNEALRADATAALKELAK
jgi:HEAT repeat protein